MITDDTIFAISTPSGTGAIAIIRISGNKTFSILNQIFKSNISDFDLSKIKSNTIHRGSIIKSNEILDDVLVSIFKSPNTYTGQDIAEINCHGSSYIQQEILKLLIDNGARMAKPGEFTLRAFINGKFDLSQAEAISDLIHSNSSIAHKVAMSQIRGGFSKEINNLRIQLLNFASLIELELDFSEEDIEFADKSKFNDLIQLIKIELEKLINSFEIGNVIKNGIPVAIVGKPNVGKSTLLNSLLNEEKAIVSEIPGTTRDSIEDSIVINGFTFRFIDTAGLRESSDTIENLGIERTYKKIEEAAIIVYVVDITVTPIEEINKTIQNFREHIKDKDKKIIVVANKTDLLIESPKGLKSLMELETVFASAKRKENLKLITDSLVQSVHNENISNATIVTNARHYEALTKAYEATLKIENGLKNKISEELIASDVKNALHYLGEITGQITSDDILSNIFEKFCIGK